MTEYHVFETHLKRISDFTGINARIEASISVGRLSICVGVSENKRVGVYIGWEEEE